MFTLILIGIILSSLKMLHGWILALYIIAIIWQL
jgi:hypothetical protein